MKKILAILSSPLKGGNTAKLVENISEEIRKTSGMDVEKVYLSDLDLKICKGCHVCIMHGEKFCPLNDSRNFLFSKMNEADGIILATPIYCMQVSTLMKVFIDHFAYLWHRPSLFHKKVLVACVGAGGGPIAKPVLDYMELNAFRWGMDVVSRISVLRFDTPLSARARTRQMEYVAKESRIFAEAVAGDVVRPPSLQNLFWFNIWRQSALAGRKNNSEDYRYWEARGWLHKESHFFYPVRLNPIHRFVVAVAGFAMGLLMRDVYNSSS
jgi:multimeric flavodoxin WrbA